MNFSGSLKFSTPSVSLTDLLGIEAVCSECTQPFQKDERVVALSEAEVTQLSDAELVIPLKRTFLVHVKGKDKGSCLEDFVSRFLQKQP